MSKDKIVLTPEQRTVTSHSGSAFISACPGAGKTHVLVERARQELKRNSTGQGLAFLSFTNAAISELRHRLKGEHLLADPPFPHYVGTFDTFLWQFFIAPLGVPGVATAPQLIPDLNERTIAPYKKAQSLSLSCFDRSTGKMLAEKAKKAGFDATGKPALTAQYEAIAKKCRDRFTARGELGFDDVRLVVKTYLDDPALSGRLALALSARFREIVVDEAQDCNPDDVGVINWLRAAGIATKVICDPHQSIYEFRGGVTEELFVLRDSFDPSDRLTMKGNFRSNSNICKAIAAFRSPGEQSATDEALGPDAQDTTPIQALLYAGTSVPLSIGQQFQALVLGSKLNPLDCPVLSSTKDAACKALGLSFATLTRHRVIRLASAVCSFHAGLETNARKEALEALHELVLELGGSLGQKTYFQYLSSAGLKPGDWRPSMLALMDKLRYDPTKHADCSVWLSTARAVMAPFLASTAGTIGQELPNHQDLIGVLGAMPVSSLVPRTIHSVKGRQFPGVCVVLSPSTCKGIVDYLTTGAPSENAESARKLYVAASRARRLLVIAIPKSQGPRLIAHIQKTGADVTRIALP
jgi:hypothetical protein